MMFSLKKKLHSQRGASMLMAMIFLMFCLLIGGTVLGAATANGSRIEHLVIEQQEFLAQRSAALVMGDMLTASDGTELQLIIKDVQSYDAENDITTHTVSYTSPGMVNITSEANFMQSILFDRVEDTYPQNTDLEIFTVQISAADAEAGVESLTANYKIHTGNDYDVTIDFGTDGLVTLTANGSVGSSENVVTIGNTTTTTKTTIIRWSLPSIQKRGA